jgi:long-chain fatty acid transport protein
VRNSFFRISISGCLTLFLMVPAFGQLAGGRTLSFSNIEVGFGARAMAMGGAFIAMADDITAINYNPAGLTQLLKPEFSLGATYGGQAIKIPYANLSTTMSGNDYYYSGRSEINLQGVNFSYGGFVIPFKIARLPIAVGFAYQIKGSNTANYNYFYVDSTGITADSTSYNIEELITTYIKQTGGTSTATLTLAIRPFEFLHLGFNLNYWRGKEGDVNSRHTTYEWYSQGVHVGNSTRIYETDSNYRISNGFSYDVGLLLKLKVISLGLVYKSGFHADYSYNYSWTDVWNSVPSMNGGNSLSGKIFWPLSYGAGVALRPLELLTIALDYTSTRWTQAKIDLGAGYVPWSYPADNPQDAHQIRLGLEYIISMVHVIVPLRAGWFADRLFWNDVNNKPVRFTGLTLGTGLVFKNLILDLAGIYHFGSYLANESDLEKTNRANWSLLASVSYRLGR